MQNQSGRIRRGDDGRGQRCSGAGRRQRGDEAIHKVRWKSDGRTWRCPGCGVDAARPEHMAGHEEEIGGWMGGTHSALLTYSTEDMVTYNEDTSCFDGSARTLRFAAE